MFSYNHEKEMIINGNFGKITAVAMFPKFMI